MDVLGTSNEWEILCVLLACDTGGFGENGL